MINNVNKTKIVENKTVIKNTNIQNNGNMVLAKNIKEVAADKNGATKFEKVAPAKRQDWQASEGGPGRHGSAREA